MQALVASSANLPVVYNAHEAGQVKGYPQTPDIGGACVPENTFLRFALLLGLRKHYIR